MGDHANGDPPAKPAQNVERLVHIPDARSKSGLIANEQDPEQRHHRHHRHHGNERGDEPGLAESPDQVGRRELQRDERNSSGGMREHAGRSGNEQGIAKGGKFIIAGDQTVTRRKSELHAVGEADDHDERRHHVQKNVQAKVEPAKRAQRQQNGGERRRGGDDHEGHAAEEQDGNQTAGNKSKRVIDQPIALDRVARLELHHRYAGQLAVQSGARQMLVDRASRTSPMTLESLSRAADGSSASTTKARLPSSASNFPRMISFDVTRLIRSWYSAPVGKGLGKRGAGICPFSGGCRAENREMTPRVPSISCRSITRSRSFSSERPIEQRGAFNHDQNVEFRGRENCG